MNIIDTLKSLDFVIPAYPHLNPLAKGEEAIALSPSGGKLDRGLAGIQSNKNAGFRVKPGMTALFIAVLIAIFALPCSAYAEKNILVFGDSLSAGYGIERNAAWPNLLQHELSKDHSQFEVVNASISGETTSGGVRRIDGVLREHRPAIVIIELGANDGLRGSSLSEIRKNLSRIIDRSQQANAKILLVGMRLPPNYGKEYVTEFQNTFVQLAKKYHIALLPFLLDGVPAEQFQADNLHPNADAQAHIMDNVMRSLRPLLD